MVAGSQAKKQAVISQIQNGTNLRNVQKKITNFKMQICLSSGSAQHAKEIFCICENKNFCQVFIQFYQL